ncbi:MAG: D-glycero-beta-D-manno-heptose 1,7-bisphosphate 7-phosphatase [Ectothiorhodospiraceae bacterium]|nr:D-glycero-beta-D-manno-heptose 1,7-bisphosphate 7-phosphatase [Ectothiorhodospiraceae bacterium]
MATKPLVILDRDGVINQDSDKFIKSVQEFVPIAGSLEAIATLNRAGYRVVIATNQSGLARGLFDLATLEAMHDKLQQLLIVAGGHIEGIFYCPHGPAAGCDCRKPLPGLLQQIAAQYEVSLVDVPVIGDSMRDLQSAFAVGARPILVRTGKGERTLAALRKPSSEINVRELPVYKDLAAAANAVVAGEVRALLSLGTGM